MKKCYSTDEESYNLSDLGDVIDSLECNGELTVGQSYYEADAVPFTSADLVSSGNVGTILEVLDDSAYEQIGEVYDYQCMKVTKEAKAELNTLLMVWAEKHMAISRFYFVKNSVKKFVTEEDIKTHTA